MVTVKQLEKGIARYLDDELAEILPQETWKKIAVATGISLIIKNMDKLVLTYKDNTVVKLTGIIDDNNNIDIDSVADVLKSQIPAEGMKINAPVVGAITFYKNDVDKLHQCIMGVETNADGYGA